MALNMMDILSDNLNTISRSIAGGTNAGWGYNISMKEKEVMTVTSDYNGTFYMRSDSWGEPKDDLCTDFKSGEKYSGSLSYNPLGYYTRKAINSGARKYTYSVNCSSNNTYLMKPDYSETGIDGSKASDVAVKPFEKQSSGVFYPEVNEENVKNASFNDETIKNEEETYRKYVHQKYTTLPGSQSEQATLKERLLKYIRDKGMNPDSSTIVSDITNYFNTKYYYDQPDIPAKENYVLYFLENTDHGICNNFASASYFLYRALGIPTRIACGYLVYGGTSNGDGTYTYSVKVKQCHAWNEIYIDGTGWKRVDNTASRTDLDDSDFNNKGDNTGKLSSSIEDMNSSGKGDDYGNSSDSGKNPDYIISGSGTGNDSSSGNGQSEDDNTRYGTGTIVINDEYETTYDGTNQSVDPDEFFKLSNYQFVDGYAYLNDSISSSNISLKNLLALIGNGDTIQYTFKYRNSERKDVGSYQFVCTSFKIIDIQGNDITSRYGINFFSDTAKKNQISVNGKMPLLTINKATATLISPIECSISSISSLPYTIDATDLGIFVTFNDSELSSYTYSVTFPKTELTEDDFVYSIDNSRYECTLTPTITIYDTNGNDCTDNFDLSTVSDITFYYTE